MSSILDSIGNPQFKGKVFEIKEDLDRHHVHAKNIEGEEIIIPMLDLEGFDPIEEEKKLFEQAVKSDIDPNNVKTTVVLATVQGSVYIGIAAGRAYFKPLRATLPVTIQ